MPETQTKIYGYRWVVLITYMFISIAMQIQWLAHAPIARASAVFYKGQFDPNSLINIDFFAMIFMIIFIIMCIPASFIIDTYGIRVGLGIGAVLGAIAAMVKGIFAANFMVVVFSQIALAIAQPFILNATTALTVRWFPFKERGTAVGLASLSQYLGIIIAMVVTPLMIVADPKLSDYGAGIDTAMLVYGIMMLIAGIMTIAIIKDRPEIPPEIESEERHKFTDGLKHIFSNRDMLLVMLIFFIGLGIFNAVSTMVDALAGSMGVNDSDGLIGGLMLIGGIIGAIIIPILSDKYRKRKIFLIIGMIGLIPGIIGLTFAGDFASTPETAYTIALVSSFIIGFFIMSAGPIGFQYAAEVSFPAPESTSQGLLLLAGQITGMIFVAGMSMNSNKYLHTFMIVFVFLSVFTLIITFFLNESPMIITEAEKAEGKKIDSK